MLAHVLSRPPDRVTYTDLALRRDDFDEIARWFKAAAPSMKASDRFRGDAGFDDYCDPSFVQPGRKPEAYRWPPR